MKSSVRRSLLAAAILAAPLAFRPLLADDGAASPAAKADADATKPVRDAFAAVQESAKAMQAAGKDQEKRKEASEAANKAREEFTKLFAACDWNLFDVETDKVVLQNGLMMVGWKALSNDDVKEAVRAFETAAAKLTDMVGSVGPALSRAYRASGEFGKAKAALENAIEKGDERMKPQSQVDLADILAAEGDYAAAQKAWQDILSSVDAGMDPRRDPRGAARAAAEMRMGLVRKPAPEIDSKTWVDGEAKPLSALKGSVVVVDFWATWCPPCRQVMPGLNKTYEQRKKDGLVVLGATRFYPGYPGFLPTAGTKDPRTDGKKVDGLTPENLVDHLKQFKANVGISYPFVVMADDSQSKAYHISSIPMLAVIDREGNVAFIKVGSGDEALLKVVIDRLLAAPSQAK